LLQRSQFFFQTCFKLGERYAIDAWTTFGLSDRLPRTLQSVPRKQPFGPLLPAYWRRHFYNLARV
jgi:hypothetical protein